MVHGNKSCPSDTQILDLIYIAKMSFNVAHDLGSKLRTRDVLLPDGCHTDFKSMLLPPLIIDGLTKAGFVQPSPIQLKAIPLARCGFDLIVQSKSGTGKTCVFTVAALDSLNVNNKRLQALVLAPTREIALQIEYVIKAIGSQFSGLEVATLIGGLPLHKDKARLKTGCHIVVGTPGRIRHCLELGLIELNAVRIFVLDEADLLMATSFQDDINAIFENLPDSKQVLACSATYTPDLVSFLGNYMQSATHVTPSGEPCPVLLGLRHFVLISPDQSSNQLRKLKAKEDQLMSILKSVPFSQCLVFSNYQTRAESICQLLRRKGWSNCCEWIAGSQDQNTRIDVYERVRDFKARILLTTDLTARGLDFEAANMVINLDVPSDPHTYLHRMGRAGRYGGHGIVITLLTMDEVAKFRKLIGKIGSYANSYIIPDNLLSKELWTAELDKLNVIEGDSESMEHNIMEPSESEIKDEVENHSDDEDYNVKTNELLEFGLKLLRLKKVPDFCSFKKLEESRRNYVSNVSNENEACKWRKVLEPSGSLDSDVAEYFISLYSQKSAQVTKMCKAMYFVEAINGLPSKWDNIKPPKQEDSNNFDIKLEKLEISDDHSVESGDNQSDHKVSVKDRSVLLQQVTSSSSSSRSSSPASNSVKYIQSHCKTDNRLFDTETNSLKHANIGQNKIKKPVHIFAPKRKLCELNSSSNSSEHLRDNEDNKQRAGASGQSHEFIPQEPPRIQKTQRKKKKKTTNPFVQMNNNSGINRQSFFNNPRDDGDKCSSITPLDQFHALYYQQLSQLRMYTNYSYYMNRMLHSQNRHS